jgi:hypothetical protein
LEQGTGRKDGVNYDASEAGKYIKVDGKPISSFPMTSDYGPRGNGVHMGKDFGIPAGLPITLTNGAKFLGFDKTSNPGGYGYFADILGGGKHWLAAHLSREGNAAPGSSGGQEPAGQQGQNASAIAGASGNSDPFAGIIDTLGKAGNIGAMLKGFYEGFRGALSGTGSSGTVSTQQSPTTSSVPSYSGGNVGTIQGVSGDRHPTILENGEYVLNQNAVRLLGKDNLDDVNFNLAPRFGDRSVTSSLMSRVKNNTSASSQFPIVVNSGGSSSSVQVPSSPPMPNDALLPSLPSMPPSRVMNSLAFRVSGTTYGLYR